MSNWANCYCNSCMDGMNESALSSPAVIDCRVSLPTGHTDAVRALAMADNKLFSGSYDGTVKVWDVETLECLKTLAGHTGPVRTLVYSGGHMFSGSYDKTVYHSCASSTCVWTTVPEKWTELRCQPEQTGFSCLL